MGIYADSLFGEATVTIQDGKLMTVRGDLKGSMEHLNRDNFRWTTDVAVLPPIPVEFHISLGIQGDIRRFGRKSAR